MSTIAFCQSALISKMISGSSKTYSVVEEFPYWTEKEMDEARYEEMKNRMLQSVERYKAKNQETHKDTKQAV